MRGFVKSIRLIRWFLSHVRDHGCTHHCVRTSLGRRDGYHARRMDTVVVEVFPLTVKPAMLPWILILKRHGSLPVLGIVTMILGHLKGSILWRENA